MNKLIVEDILNKEDITEVYKQYKYFPMDLLMADDTDVQMVLGVRGDGKTYNAKKNILKDWYEKKIKSYWIVPTKTMMEDMIATKDFHMDMLIDEWPYDEGLYDDEKELIMEEIREKYSEDDITCHTYAEKTTMDREFLYDDKGDWFCRMIPLSMYHKYKAGKHPRVLRLYYDEFMREDYLKNEAFKIMDLLTSVQREKKGFKFILLGNAISLNHPLFVAMNIYKLDEKIITVISDEKGKLAKVWRWKRPEEDAENKNGDLIWYRLGDVTGYNDYAVKNKFKNDNLDNILPWAEIEPHKQYLQYLHTFKMGSVYVNVYYIPKEYNDSGHKLYYYRVTKDDKDIKSVQYALSREDVTDKIVFSPNMAIEIAHRLQKDMMWYDSVVTKQELWAVLKNHF